MTRMTRPDCAVMCNLFNKYTHTLYDTMIIIRIQSTTTVLVHTVPRNNTTTRILNASRPSEHFPVRGEISKRLGGIIGCKYKTSSCHLNGFPDGSNIGSTV